MSKRVYRVAPLLAALVLSASAASAQAPPPPERDGARFRGGVSLTGGGLFVSGFAAGMGGIDGRLGVQINNLIGVYAQPAINFGAGKIGTATGFTGFGGSTLVVDATFLNQIFVGLGGGGGILGSAPVGALHIRAGGYPLWTHGENGIRRKGLEVGLDLRIYFAGGFKVLNPMLSVGYEAF